MGTEFKMSNMIGSIYAIPGLKYKGPLPIISSTTSELIIDTVARHFGLDVSAVKSKNRKHELVLARQVSFYLMRKLTKKSLKTIADELGGRDHTTVIHGISTLNNLMQTDEQVRKNVQLIEYKLS